MGVKCPKCGADNPETSTFCADCDTQLLSPDKIDVTKTAETPKKELTTIVK
jgi:ribosomal protein L40E